MKRLILLGLAGLAYSFPQPQGSAAPSAVPLKSALAAPSYQPVDDNVPGGFFGIDEVLASFGSAPLSKEDLEGLIYDASFIFPSMKNNSLPAMIRFALGGGAKGIMNAMSEALGSGKASSGLAALTGMLGGLATVDNAQLAGLAPAKAKDVKIGDFYKLICSTLSPNATNPLSKTMVKMFGSPQAVSSEPCEEDLSGGSGPFKSKYTTDPSLPEHTIYVPAVKTDEKLPVIVFGNGLCLPLGLMYANMLNEIASYGFMVIANGNPLGPTKMADASFNHISDMVRAIDWAHTPAAQKYGNVDTSNLAVAGQSCGALESYSASYMDPRVKNTVLLNAAVFEAKKAPMVAKINSTVAYFVGGPLDIGYNLVDRDFPYLTGPVLKASLNVGHLGTYYQKSGGAFGKAASGYFNWKMKGNETYKPMFCGAGNGLAKDGWNVTDKNGMC